MDTVKRGRGSKLNSESLTVAKQSALTARKNGETFVACAKAAGVSVAALIYWRKKDAAFATEWSAANPRKSKGTVPATELPATVSVETAPDAVPAETTPVVVA